MWYLLMASLVVTETPAMVGSGCCLSRGRELPSGLLPRGGSPKPARLLQHVRDPI